MSVLDKCAGSIAGNSLASIGVDANYFKSFDTLYQCLMPLHCKNIALLKVLSSSYIQLSSVQMVLINEYYIICMFGVLSSAFIQVDVCTT